MILFQTSETIFKGYLKAHYPQLFSHMILLLWTMDMSCVLILLYLSAAFYTVSDQIFSKVGFSGTALDWFRPYLYGQAFKVS